MNFIRSLVTGGVRNPVLVNLMMACILVGGVFAARGMVRESLPEFALDHIAIEVVYPGASTADVEKTICTPIEEALRGLRGVREISSSANENFGTVWVGLQSSVEDLDAALAEVKGRVDQITDFPELAEKPVVREMFIRSAVVNIAIFGDVPERTLKEYALEVRNDLVSNPGISQVSLSGVRNSEILIEVPQQALLAHDLSLAQVMAVVKNSSMDMPAGIIRTTDEEVTLRVTGQRFTAAEYERLVVIGRADSVVLLGDIATVSEGFEDSVVRGRFQGEPAVMVQVYNTSKEDAIEIGRVVRDYVAARLVGLPDRLGMYVWADASRDIDSRITMLVTNGAMGVALVFLTLLFFIELRVAFWVAAGIPVSFAGALIVMYSSGATINLISLFALILVSGIIVDDAIVIGDSIRQRRRDGLAPDLAAIEGASAMALPVLGASITTIISFVPLLYILGVMGRLIYVLPVVVIGAICASAFEAFVVLPSHLSHGPSQRGGADGRPESRFRRRMDGFIDHVITDWYRPLYRLALERRVVVIAGALGLLLIALGMVFGGRTPLVMLSQEDGNFLRARVHFPEGTPVSVTRSAMERLERAALALNDDPELAPAADGPLVKQVYSLIGEFADFLPIRGNNLCETRVELMPAELRRIRDEVIMEHWRAKVGTIHDAIIFRISRQELGPLGRPIEIKLLGMDLEDMSAASERIQQELGKFEGVLSVEDDLVIGKREMRITLRPAARYLGMTLADVAEQLRHGFFGGEAVVLRRGRDEVKVRVRYPEDERKSIANLESIRIRTPQGDAIPFSEVADVEWARGYKIIMHQDGKRRVRILADVDDRIASAEDIMETLAAGFLDEVVADYNGLSWVFGGNREQMDESLSSLWKGFALALIAIYTVLGALLRSYSQPIVILVAVPLGLIGAVFGHAIFGLDLTLLSLFGVVALSGVVVNDALVLLDVINTRIKEGASVDQAVREAGELRFRAVTLTTITTIMGLAPLLFERSSQAQMIIPMAVSITFGELFGTALTLFVVPSLFLVVNDMRRFVHWLRNGGRYPSREQVEGVIDTGVASAG